MKKSSIFKLLSVMLAVLIVAAVIGCGKGGEQKATPTAVPTATSSPTATTPAGQSGTLSDIAGEVQVIRSGASAWTAATNGMKIWTGDGLKTGSNGYVLVTFFDGSVMEVEADTEISVDELSQAAGGSTTVRIQQTIGNTLNRVQNLVDSSSTYEVDTLAGSAVVRGTIFEMLVEMYGEQHRACVGTWNEEDEDEDDGTQHSTDFSGGGKTVNVPEDKSSCCWEGGQPSEPFYTDPADDPYQGGDGGGGSSCIPCESCEDCMYLGPSCYCNYGCCVCQQTSTPYPCPSYEYDPEGCCYEGPYCVYCVCMGGY